MPDSRSATDKEIIEEINKLIKYTKRIEKIIEKKDSSKLYSKKNLVILSKIESSIKKS